MSAWQSFEQQQQESAWISQGVLRGATGATGPAGPNAVSTDAYNSLYLGSDSKIYYEGPFNDVAQVDFGSLDNGGADTMIGKTTVTGSWIRFGVSQPVAVLCTGSDHLDQEDMIVEELVVYVANIVNGVSFDILIYAPNGTQGIYQVNWISS